MCLWTPQFEGKEEKAYMIFEYSSNIAHLNIHHFSKPMRGIKPLQEAPEIPRKMNTKKVLGIRIEQWNTWNSIFGKDTHQIEGNVKLFLDKSREFVTSIPTPKIYSSEFFRYKENYPIRNLRQNEDQLTIIDTR